MPRIRLLKKKKKAPRDNHKGNRRLRNLIYHDTRWQSLRNEYIREHPLCEFCLEGDHCNPRVQPATEVHHVIPFSKGFKGDELTSLAYELAFDKENLKSTCLWHHLFQHNNLKHPPKWWHADDDFLD